VAISRACIINIVAWYFS